MVKQRNDLSDAYQKAGRQDLLDKERRNKNYRGIFTKTA